MELLEDMIEANDATKKASKLIKRLFTPRIILIILALIILISPIIYIIWQNNVIDELRKENEELIKLLEDPLIVSPVTPLIVIDIIESEFNGIDELSTVEYLFTDSGRFTDSQQIGNWTIPMTEKSFSLKWNGTIKAGIHLHEIGYDVSEATITVTIPAAEIFSYEVDQSSYEVLDEKNNVFNPITVEDKIKFDADTEQYMKERAIESGLLTKAQENAKMLIQNLLIRNPQIGSNYEIEFVFADN